MSEDRRKVETFYGGKLRVRVCGVLRRAEDDAILCGLHRGVGPLGRLWVPPGGGLQFGETLAEGLKREFFEETGLSIERGEQVGLYEYVQPPLHALELFFNVYLTKAGIPKLGSDPEWPIEHPPLLEDLAWISKQDVDMEDRLLFHAVVHSLLRTRNS